MKDPALEKRRILIFEVTDICVKNDINIVNPMELLKEYDPDGLVLEDLAHYSPKGSKVWYDYLESYIDTMLSS